MSKYSDAMRDAVFRSSPPYKMILRREVGGGGWLQVAEHNESENGIGRFVLEDGTEVSIAYADISVIFKSAVINSFKDSRK